MERLGYKMVACVLAAASSTGAATGTQSEAKIRPTGLRCEYQANPIGIDAVPPTVSWQITPTDPTARGLRQSAYRILAASSRDLLEQGEGDLWDSGRVASGRQTQVPYGGAALQPGQRVWWCVQVWDQDGGASGFSEVAWWEMGLLGNAGWKGQWIQRDEAPITEEQDYFKEHPAPLLRKGFAVTKPVRRARAYVSGLGYYELRLNGDRVGDHELDPGWTPYAKRVFYSTYDVTGALQEGDNALGILLGNGWYNPLPMRMWNRFNLREALTVGPPRVMLQLDIEYEDGSTEHIVTDETWKTGASPILKNSVYLGEVYDARREQPGWDRPGFDDSAWAPAKAATVPLGPLQAQPMPPIRVTDTVRPVKITEAAEGVYLFDLGENFAGRVRLRCEGPAGTRIQLRYGELLYPDGSLNPMTAVCGQIKNYTVPEGSEAPSTAWQCDTYILKGGGPETFTPRFTFHGFRYVEVTGYPGTPTLDAIEGQRLHSSVTPASAFACSNDLFNRIQEVTVRTLRSNLHSVQSDCPHREKFGYGGDLVADSAMALYNFDMAAFYVKTVQDYADDVRPNGGFTETAPYVGIGDAGLGEGSGPIGWGTVHPLLQTQLYQHYGEERLLREQYAAGKRWIALLEASSTDGLLPNGIGDHESLVDKDTTLTGSAFFYYNASLMAHLAHILGESQDAAHYQALADRVRDTINAKLFTPETGLYGIGSQANQAFALYMDLVPEASRADVLDALLHDIRDTHQGHLSTGIFGTRFLLPVLSDLGHADVAYGIVNQPDFPGWAHMIANGATTLWEHWEFSDNTFSHNHPMFGSVSEWFYSRLAGIRPADEACGFDRIVIQPHVAGDLTWVKAHYDSVRGRIAVDWKIANDRFDLAIRVPVNTTADVYVPRQGEADVYEGDTPALEAPGISGGDGVGDYLHLRVGSSSYRFHTAWSE